MSENPNALFTQSVTRDEYNKVTESGGVIRFIIPFWNMYNQGGLLLPPQPPAYYSMQRDAYLRASIHNEAMWAAAIGIAITKMTSLAWEFQSGISIRARRAQEIMLQADGRQVGWVGFLAKHLRDYLTTDNGAHTEIIRASKSPNSRIIGLKHLDSLRCTRTGDPEIPIVYRDKLGRLHAMHDHEIFSISDMPDSSETYWNVGFCAASRAYYAIYKLATIEWYLREKVGGLHPLEIHIVNGILTNQIEAAVKAAQEETISKGAASYMGAVIIGTPKETPPQVVSIPLASLPDRFNRKEEFDIALLTYADAIGLDPQDLQPLSGQSLGSGAQSQVLEDKVRGKGLSSWRQAFTHAINEYVLDEQTKFVFIERDYRDQERRTAVQKARADVSKVRIDAQITNPQQELQVLVDADDLPKEFLKQDLTPGEAVSDTDKPEQEDLVREGAMAAEPPAEGEADAGAAGEAKKPDATKQPPAAEKPAPAAQPVQGKPANIEIEDKKRWGTKKKEHYSGAMVALFLPKEIAEQVALGEADALPASDLHITLYFLGDTATGDLDRDKIEEAVREAAAHTPAIKGRINGQGRFIVDGDPTDNLINAHFLTFDCPALPDFRQRLVEAIRACEAGTIQENHGFTPHITLIYKEDAIPPAVDLPIGGVRFPALTLAWGDERINYPFSGEKLKATDASLEEATELLRKVIDKARKRAPKQRGKVRQKEADADENYGARASSLLAWGPRAQTRKHLQGQHDQETHGLRGGESEEGGSVRSAAEVRDELTQLIDTTKRQGYYLQDQADRENELATELRSTTLAEYEKDNPIGDFGTSRIDGADARDKGSYQAPWDLAEGNAPDWASQARDLYVVNDDRTLKNNMALRAGDPPGGWAKKVDKLTTTSEFVKPTAVYRGAAMRPDQIKTLVDQKSFTDKAFMSTGSNRGTAEGYARGRTERQNVTAGHQAVIFNLTAPTGFKFGRMDASEYVMPRNTRVVITGVHHPTTPGGFWEIFGELEHD